MSGNFQRAQYRTHVRKTHRSFGIVVGNSLAKRLPYDGRSLNNAAGQRHAHVAPLRP